MAIILKFDCHVERRTSNDVVDSKRKRASEAKISFLLLVLVLFWRLSKLKLIDTFRIRCHSHWLFFWFINQIKIMSIYVRNRIRLSLSLSLSLSLTLSYSRTSTNTHLHYLSPLSLSQTVNISNTLTSLLSHAWSPTHSSHLTSHTLSRSQIKVNCSSPHLNETIDNRPCNTKRRNPRVGSRTK